MDTDLLLQLTLSTLERHWAARGWAPVSPPSSVLAMTKPAGTGVEHTLFVTTRENVEADGTVLLSATINVHYPELEALINRALDRDAAEAGRQSLRLSLSRLLTPGHPRHGRPFAVRLPLGDAPARGFDVLLADADAALEPVRAALVDLQALRSSLPPPTVDPWVWALRRAAYHQLHAEPATREAVLSLIEAQARHQLGASAGADAGGVDDGSPAWPGEAGAEAQGARVALTLVRALRRPQRRVIEVVALP